MTKASGTFDRDMNYIPDRITVDGRDGWPVEPDRYRLIVAHACPWANRSLITHRLLGLEDAISVGVAGPLHDASSWNFHLDPDGLDPVLGLHKLQEAFFNRFADYPRGITVPAIVEVESKSVVTNDFPLIEEDLSKEWSAFHREGAPDLWPEAHRDEMDALSDQIFHDVNNGVYKSGFAGSQDAYDSAVTELFDTLDWLEERLAKTRYLAGDRLTEADVRLFTTLVRFDAVYAFHFRCNLRLLRDYTHVHAYLRELYTVPAFRQTTDMDHIRHHYYRSHESIHPGRIVPIGPNLNLDAPHGREHLGGLSPVASATNSNYVIRSS